MRAFVVCLLTAAICAHSDTTPEKTSKLAPRKEFSIHLAKLRVAFDEETGQKNKVKIRFGRSDEQIIITTTNDFLEKRKRNGKETVTFRESIEKAYQLSDFEAEHLSHVCKTMIKTLDDFESDLKKERWGRCLYLDAYLPRFLDGFYTLICAAKASSDALPRHARAPRDAYDVSQSSPKSDKRINSWRLDEEKRMKLRIATKELIYQTKKWSKKELRNKKRNRDLSYSDKFDRAFTSFVHTYFGLDVKPSIVRDKRK
ncbi:MAG: hypothetical protein ACLFQB_14265 [Chitinispirillaceae bacterium]